MSPALNALALVGVPLAVLTATGGFRTVGFWMEALLMIPLTLFSVMAIGLTLIIPLMVFLWILDLLLPSISDRAATWAGGVLWSLAALYSYVTAIELDATGVRLPTPWSNVGVLLVLFAAAGATCGLLALGARLEVPRKSAIPWSPPHESYPPEPEEEFWSDELVAGWRSWTYTGGVLEGAFAVWETDQFDATCKVCSTPPGWNHSCGVYGIKDPGDVQQFHTTSQVVGLVEMWGTVIEHEHGYRASHARITDLWAGDPNTALELQARFPALNVWVGIPERESVQGG